MRKIKTRRQFRASLGGRTARRQGTKAKRASSGEMVAPIKKTVAQRIKAWAKTQEVE